MKQELSAPVSLPEKSQFFLPMTNGLMERSAIELSRNKSGQSK